MSDRVFGSPFQMYEVSIAGKTPSHLPVPVQNVVDAQAYADRSQFTSRSVPARGIPIDTSCTSVSKAMKSRSPNYHRQISYF